MVGKTLSHYKILQELGRGGMGIVYKAKDTRLHRTVAIKVLLAQKLATREDKARFYREARAAAQLNHPGIASVYEIDEDDRRPFIVMEYLEGKTLSEKLGRGCLPIREVADIGLEIADALSAAHKKGIVHRDIKPDNIMIVDGGHVKIMDFGIAKDLGGKALTKSNVRLGTVPYMSPEQLRGDKVDWRTDAWALGVVLYEMLTDKLPFEGSNQAEEAYLIQNLDPENPSSSRADIPDKINALVLNLLNKEKKSRCTSLADVVAVLRPSSSVAEGIASAPDIPMEFQVRTPRKSAFIKVSILAVVLVASLWTYWFTSRRDTVEPPEEQTTIAILPFTVQDESSSQYLGKNTAWKLGLVFDAVGLRIVDPELLRAYVAESQPISFSPDVGQSIAEHFNATHFVLGNVFGIGGKTFINASLYSSDGQLQSRTNQIEAADTLIVEAIDQLADHLLTEQLSDPALSFERISVRVTESYQALGHFIAGQEAARAGMWSEAFTEYQEAVDIDSTFALAWIRWAKASFYVGFGNPTDVLIAKIKPHLWKLPEKEQNIAKSSLAMSVGNVEEAERLLLPLTRQYPNDAWIQFYYGELLFNFNSLRGRRASESRPYFEKALAIDSENHEIRGHLVGLAAEEEDWETHDSLYAISGALGIHSGRAQELLSTLAQGDESLRSRVISELGLSGPSELLQAALLVAAFVEDYGLAVDIIQPIITTSTDDVILRRALIQLGIFHSALGQVRLSQEAFRKARELGTNRIWPILTSSHTFPLSEDWIEDLIQSAETVSSDPDRLYARGLVHWYSDNRPALRETILALESTLRETPGDSLARNKMHRLEMLASYSDGVYARALEQFERSKIDFTYVQSSLELLTAPVLERFVYAQSLYNLNRKREALAWLNALGDGALSVGVRWERMACLLGPSYHLRGIIYDELGDTDNAIQFYSKLVELWKDADEELQPLVRETHARLNELLLASTHE